MKKIREIDESGINVRRFAKIVIYGASFLIIIYFLAIILFATLLVKGVKDIEEHGLKSLVERIWEGKK